MRWISFLLIVCTVFLATCSSKGKVFNDINAAVKEFDACFEKSKKGTWALAKFLEDLLKNRSQYDLSTDKMDISKGGKYRFHNGHMYHSVKEEGKPAAVMFQDLPPDRFEKARQLLRLYEYSYPFMVKNYVDNVRFFIMSYDGTAIAYPWIDAISSIPPNFPYQTLFWYYLGDEKHNPERKLVATGEPFVEIVGSGFIKVYIAPFYDGNKFMGVCNSDIYVTPLSREVLRKYDSPLLFLSSESLVIGANKKAIELLNVKVLKEFEYIKQLLKNEFAPDEYRLTFKDNPQWLKDLGNGIKQGKNDFEITVDGVVYIVHTKALPSQNDLIVAGLYPK